MRWAERGEHRRFAGMVKQVLMGTAAMLRVEVPEIILPANKWTGRGSCENDTKLPAFVTFVSPASLYGLTPCSEEFARRQAESFCVIPPGFMLPVAQPKALTMEEARDDDRDDDEIDIPF